jgi:glutaredoxin-related protein
VSKKKIDKTKPRRNKGYRIPILVIVVFAVIAVGAYVALTRMAVNNNDYKRCEYGEGSLGIYIGGDCVKSINNETLIQRIQQVVGNVSSTYGLANVKLIMFGSKTCPHCQKMNEFFTAEFREEYFPVWVSGENLTWFVEIASVEYEVGLPEQYSYAVPQTLVLDRNGLVKAIVIGEIVDKKFWAAMLENVG